MFCAEAQDFHAASTHLAANRRRYANHFSRCARRTHLLAAVWRREPLDNIHSSVGAVREVVADPRQTSRATNQCGEAFNDDYLITGMQQGAMVTFRVSADDYRTQEFPVTILGDIDDQMFNFKLEKQ